MSNGGRYLSDPIVKLLSDGTIIKLVDPFTYIDPGQRNWTVPKDAQGDGASIPRPLWSIIGSPLSGRYRDASIIHDFYCSKRNRLWKDVHRVFFDAMITSGVSIGKAKVMYAGVYLGGPRWSDMDVANANVNVLEEMLWVPVAGSPPGVGSGGGGRYVHRKRPREVPPKVTYAYQISEQDVDDLKSKYGGGDTLDLDKIEAELDRKINEP
jgi:hypothetical protein